MNSPHVRTLERALKTLGSKERLAQALGVEPAELDAYLQGEEPLPAELYLNALDIVAGKRGI